MTNDTRRRAPNGAPLRYLQGVVANPPSDCAIWPYGLAPQGYGHIRYQGRTQTAHRVALALATGQEPAGLEAAHSCRNRNCVNPNHLRWATISENQMDRHRDGTASKGSPCGTPNGRMKIGPTDAIQIVLLARSYTQQQIADWYGLTQAGVSAIVRGRNWSWATGIT